jgi:anaerobic magnesium-protoporphyrin IX monomethyl ester cyclase
LTEQLPALGNVEEAHSDLRRVVSTDPTRTDALEALGALRPIPRWRGMRDGVLVLGLPSWTVGYPFYSLMVVAGIAEASGTPARIADLNVRFYHLVTDADKQLWGPAHTAQWMPGGVIPGPLDERYGRQLEELVVAAATERAYGMFLLTVNMSNRYFTNRAVALLKARFPDVPVLLGGVDCFPREHGRRFFAEANPADVICQGEAEEALPAFLAEYAATGRLSTTTPGFAGFANGGFFDSGEPPLPSLRSSPLPSLSGIDFAAYKQPGHFPLLSSRGCVNRCLFCSESPNFKRFRFRPAEQTFAELRYLYGFAVEHAAQPTVHFADSLVNGSIPELEKLCQLIIESGISIIWGGQAHFREEMTLDLLSLMRRAGFRSAFWGLESGSQEVVDLMNKRYSLEVAKRILGDCSRVGIQSILPLIVGFPGETTLHLAETSLFIEAYRSVATFLDPNECCVRPNSPLHDRFAELGLANNLYTEWTTIDGTSTPVVRLTRLAVIRAVLKGSGPLRSAIAVELCALHISPEREEVVKEVEAFLDARELLKSGGTVSTPRG